MQADFYKDDPKTLWQDQQTETSEVSVILIRQKERQLRSRKLRQIIGTFVAPMAGVFFYGFCLKQVPSLHPLLHTAFVFSLAWGVAGAYYLNRATSSGAMPRDAGLSTGLEFCRREMERQLSYLCGALLWSFGPIALAIVTLILTLATRMSMLSRGMPLITIALIWVVAYLVIRARQLGDIKRELDELTEMEKDRR